MESIVNPNSEAGFVLKSLFEFMKAWEAGKNSKLQLESKNSKAWVNFSCYLGAPQDLHVKPRKTKNKSSKRRERDNQRARLHQLKLNGNSDEADSALVSSEDNHVDGEAASAETPPTSDIVIESELNTDAVAASDDISDIVNDHEIKTESIHGFMYLFSEKQRLEDCCVKSRTTVAVCAEEVLDLNISEFETDLDTKISEIEVTCENRIEGEQYVSFTVDDAPFDEHFDKNLFKLKTLGSRPFIYKLKVMIRYCQDFGKVPRENENFKPFAVSFRKYWNNKEYWFRNYQLAPSRGHDRCPDEDVYITFSGCCRRE